MKFNDSTDIPDTVCTDSTTKLSVFQHSPGAMAQTVFTFVMVNSTSTSMWLSVQYTLQKSYVVISCVCLTGNRIETDRIRSQRCRDL